MFHARTPACIALLLAATALGGIAAQPSPAALHVPTTGAPAAPDGCVALRYPDPFIGGWRASVTWRDNSDNEDGFIIEWRGTHSGGGTTTVPANTTQVAGLPSGPNYKYRVRAFNTAGQSAWTGW